MVAKKSTVRKEPLGRALNDLRRRLDHYRVFVMVAVSALKHQNAENDADIGLALMRGVSDPLFDEIELLEKWSAQLQREKPLLCLKARSVRA